MNGSPSASRGPAIAITAVVVAVAALGFFLWRSMVEQAAPPPEFPLLSDAPDPSLRGTVAWYDMSDQCVHVIAASGAAERQVFCPEERDLTGGIVLEWLDGGRLEMTLWDWPMPDPKRIVWRKVIDVATLAVEEVAVDPGERSVPFLPEPGPTPDGHAITTAARGGRLTITLDDGSSTRVLFDGQGAPDYGAEVFPPVWSPDYRWLLVDDGRLLVVTLADPSTTRILVEHPPSWTSARITGFALTGEDLLQGG